MKKLLLASAAALGLVAWSGVANATLTYTIWTGSGLSPDAIFPVPTTGLLATFTDTNETLNFVNNNPQGGAVTFANFFTPSVLALCNAANPACGGTTMSTVGNGTTTFLRVTESYTLAAPFTSTLSHDDGAAVYIDGAGNGGQLCGNPIQASLNTQTCVYAAGTHTLTLLYTEDNGSPAVLQTTLPTETTTGVPEPASLALLGTGLLGFGLMRRRRKN